MYRKNVVMHFLTVHSVSVKACPGGGGRGGGSGCHWKRDIPWTGRRYSY